MSHAYGQVLIQKGQDWVTFGWFEYNGTVDIAIPSIWRTQKETSAHWREDGPFKKCTCGKLPEPVLLRADYGSGIEWQGEACLDCRVIIGPLDPYVDYAPRIGGGKE